MRIAFLWDGISRMQDSWRDGLWLATEILKENHELERFEPDATDDIVEWGPDVILYWGALQERLKHHVLKLPYPKANCWAGGPIEPEHLGGIDLYFIENQVVQNEFAQYGAPTMIAFGVNEKWFNKQRRKKIYKASFAGAFAAWKRHELFADSFDHTDWKGICFGQMQEHEPHCYEYPKSKGIIIKDRQDPREVAKIINQSEYVLNPASYWGGGQRLTLEAMACDVPPIVMDDSPKNCEYVDEAGFGHIVSPSSHEIRPLLAQEPQKEGGRKYIKSKWTGRHYAENLEKGLLSIV